MISDWNNLANGVVSTDFGPPNEVTVLFDERTLTFPMPAAATLTDLAQRLTEEGGPRGQMLSVTIKLGGQVTRRNRRSTPVSAAGNPMTGHRSGPRPLAYRFARLRPAQRALVLFVSALSPWLAIVLAVRLFW